MYRIRRKLTSAVGDMAYQPTGQGVAGVPAQPSADEHALAFEFQDWARWLDGLRDAARAGQMPALRALAHGKLRFLLRRSLRLRDHTMLGLRQQARLTEAGNLIDEFAQLMRELTGRPVLPADEWPLPARLYDAAPPQNQGGRLPGERRQQPARQNRLDAVSLDLALQVHNSLQLTLRLLQQHGSLAGSPAMRHAGTTLAHAAVLAHLLTGDA